MVSGRGIDLLLIVRGLAALSVIVWHTEGYKALYSPVLNTSGRMAVWLFFGISGYGVAYGFVHGHYRLTMSELTYFYWNRFLRIYPLFSMLIALAWGTVWFTTGNNPIAWADVPAEFFAVQWNHGYNLIGAFWALGVILHFYLLAPLFAMPILLRSRIQPWLTLVIYIGLVCWCEWAVTHLNWSWDGRNIVSNLPHFFAGMIACRLVASLERPRTWVVVLCLVCAVGLLGYTNWIYHIRPGYFWSVRGVLLADTLIMLLVIAHGHLEKWPRLPRPGRVVVAAFYLLGTLSYGVYAWHGYIIKYIPWTAEHMVVLILLSVVLAYLSYLVIERPALNLKKYPVKEASLAVAVKPMAHDELPTEPDNSIRKRLKGHPE